MHRLPFDVGSSIHRALPRRLNNALSLSLLSRVEVGLHTRRGRAYPRAPSTLAHKGPHTRAYNPFNRAAARLESQTLHDLQTHDELVRIEARGLKGIRGLPFIPFPQSKNAV